MDVEEILKERIREAEEFRLRDERVQERWELAGVLCVVAVTVFVWFVLPILEAAR